MAAAAAASPHPLGPFTTLATATSAPVSYVLPDEYVWLLSPSQARAGSRHESDLQRRRLEKSPSPLSSGGAVGIGGVIVLAGGALSPASGVPVSWPTARCLFFPAVGTTPATAPPGRSGVST